MLENLDILVELAEARTNFRARRPYRVFAGEADRMLLVDDTGRFAWLPAVDLSPLTITQGDKKLYNRDEFLQRRRYDPFIDRSVLLTTWEDLGIPLERRTEEGMYIYRAVVDGFDGQLLMLRGGEGFSERTGVLATQVYAIEDAGPDGAPSVP